jgi:hypothetical protein
LNYRERSKGMPTSYALPVSTYSQQSFRLGIIYPNTGCPRTLHQSSRRDEDLELEGCFNSLLRRSEARTVTLSWNLDPRYLLRGPLGSFKARVKGRNEMWTADILVTESSTMCMCIDKVSVRLFSFGFCFMSF